MEEISRYLRFLRQWRVLLILGIGLGALGGLALHFQQSQPVDYTATAELLLPNHVEFTIVSPSKPSGQEAADHIVKQANRLQRFVDAPVKVQKLRAERHDTSVWKPAVLGAVIGVLIVIVGIFVWEDGRNYVRRHME